MHSEITIAEPKPRFAPEGLHGFERVPGFLGHTPTPLLVCESRERVENAVEIRRDGKPQHFEVVADVDDRGDVCGIDLGDDTADEPRTAHAAGEDGDLPE